MGFPKSHRMLNVGGSDLSNSDRRQLLSDTEVYRQFGNSVVVPLATHLAEALVEQLKPLIKVK
jgi:site-specific DNA-cytosine methylase